MSYPKFIRSKSYLITDGAVVIEIVTLIYIATRYVLQWEIRDAPNVLSEVTAQSGPHTHTHTVGNVRLHMRRRRANKSQNMCFWSPKSLIQTRCLFCVCTPPPLAAGRHVLALVQSARNNRNSRSECFLFLTNNLQVAQRDSSAIIHLV